MNTRISGPDGRLGCRHGGALPRRDGRTGDAVPGRHRHLRHGVPGRRPHPGPARHRPHRHATAPHPSAFTGTVLGVLTDGIEPGVDMVMAKLSSPDDRRRRHLGGHVRLAGVRRGRQPDRRRRLHAGLRRQTPIAGITPWEDMQTVRRQRGSGEPARPRLGGAKPSPAATDGHHEPRPHRASTSSRRRLVVAGLSDRAPEQGDVAARTSATGHQRRRPHVGRHPRRSPTWSRAATSSPRVDRRHRRSAGSAPSPRSAATASSASATR